MIERLIKLESLLNQRGLRKESEELNRIMKDAGLFDRFKGMFSSEEDKLRADIDKIKERLLSFPALQYQTEEEYSVTKKLYENLARSQDRLHEIAPEPEPFVEPEHRAILLGAIENYLRKVSSYSEYSQDQLSRVKVLSLTWSMDHGEYIWEARVSRPDHFDPDNPAKDRMDLWDIWYGEVDEKIYYGPTEKFEIDGVKYHLAGES